MCLRQRAYLSDHVKENSTRFGLNRPSSQRELDKIWFESSIQSIGKLFPFSVQNGSLVNPKDLSSIFSLFSPTGVSGQPQGFIFDILTVFSHRGLWSGKPTLAGKRFEQVVD
ncbi:hypothetical protein RRG08_010402 [Elysia crispata]|uniref:Uncharacterized protein n=1 Tax=Elysia crispata TaxID=231223 RepID=A0AAE1BBU8_9GAST|nr:hypothetical protein RRG08_010402 [Elysia crispata]